MYLTINAARSNTFCLYVRKLVGELNYPKNVFQDLSYCLSPYIKFEKIE